jgi:hypothetical protein
MTISLQGAILSCKVDTAWASRHESDRFLNPNEMVCPVWNGLNTKGQRVCENSFYTKREGCNSAMDRVSVENELRPSYSQYITLDAAGLRGDELFGEYASSCDRPRHSGNFGLDLNSYAYPPCSCNRNTLHAPNPLTMTCGGPYPTLGDLSSEQYGLRTCAQNVSGYKEYPGV